MRALMWHNDKDEDGDETWYQSALLSLEISLDLVHVENSMMNMTGGACSRMGVSCISPLCDCLAVLLAGARSHSLQADGFQ